MFEAVEEMARMEKKEEIDFDAIQYPFYRKDTHNGEWYKFHSIDKFSSIRTGYVIAVGVIKDVAENLFIDLYSFRDECTEAEYNEALEAAMKEING